MKAIIDRIIILHNQNVFKDVFELNKFPEMKSSVCELTKKLLEVRSEHDFDIDTEDKESINSMLNAHFIMKLKNDELIKNIEMLDKIFNNL